MSTDSILDGSWFSRIDGDFRGNIEDGTLVWEEDGTATPLSRHGERGDVVSMVVDGDAHFGVLSEDGRLLKWQDGDIWKRALPRNRLDVALSMQGNSDLDLDGSLPWAGWNLDWRPMTVGRPTSKSAARVAITNLAQTWQMQCETPQCPSKSRGWNSDWRPMTVGRATSKSAAHVAITSLAQTWQMQCETPQCTPKSGGMGMC